ncbi:HNH endonuclease signature motif containing protein [Oscillatoria sp. CS-180]|uniref:HNH endonuclease n=1 Tax=Oscillatoria sp. CS-180 TaxID=3021720 RepID=UPI00232B0191|nr:HNH endonuclease signature motif containing protein [Oscillatoria sp. CS-180]MDB9524900.1 HNH endonuclease signature motif containing protein [Oscillatoria sp. CS-180]
MSKSRISESLRLAIVEQFQSRCAYCQTQQQISGVRLTVDHIIPESLGGATEKDNLCLACWDCNLYKASRVAVFDAASQQETRLFHPQKQLWSDHFEWNSDSTLMFGKTIVGRISIDTLRMNRVELVLSRKLWVKVGWHPPA